MNKLYDCLTSISPLTDETWDKLKVLFGEKALPKGEYLIEEGETAAQIGFLIDGVIRVFYRNSEGFEYNKHFFGAGEIAGGYSSLITGSPSRINQQALSDCHLLTADYAKIVALYDEHRDLERLSRRIAESYFVEKEQREIELILFDAARRCQDFLYRFPRLEQTIPQYHIASYLGVTPTQLSRIRRKFSGR